MLADSLIFSFIICLYLWGLQKSPLITAWTNKNTLYFLGTKEVTSLKGVTLCSPNIKPRIGMALNDFHAPNTGWTNVNLLCFSYSTEIASFKGLTLWCSEINQSKWPLAWWCMMSMHVLKHSDKLDKFKITEIVRRISASFQYNCAKNDKGLKFTQRKPMPHRSVIGLGAFRKIKYFGDIPRQLLCI